jgi:hypothetical protein
MAHRDILHRHSTSVANGAKRKSKGRRLSQRATLMIQVVILRLTTTGKDPIDVR